MQFPSVPNLAELRVKIVVDLASKQALPDTEPSHGSVEDALIKTGPNPVDALTRDLRETNEVLAWLVTPITADGGNGVEAPIAAPSRIATVNGQTIEFAPIDALALFGALALAVDGDSSQVKLASGDTLELNHTDVSELGRQLAGKPADEVPG